MVRRVKGTVSRSEGMGQSGNVDKPRRRRRGETVDGFKRVQKNLEIYVKFDWKTGA